MGDLIAANASPADGEVVPPGEPAAIEAIVARIVAQVREEARTGPARRDAHPKAHGCARARFEVLDGLPARLRVGLFTEAKTYDAYVRFSNGSPKAQPDACLDVRGMAIKVLDVAGSFSTTQDFVMINGPRFFVRSAPDYVAFVTADPQWRFFAPSLNPFAMRLREGFNLFDIIRRKPANPLDARYWSTLPFKFGAGAFKYTARPVAPASPFHDTSAENFLRDNLRRHLAAEASTFEFMVQLRTRPDAMPIEDPTIEWRERDALFETVARLTIPPQDITQTDALGENLSFTPWHGHPDHRPLGGINRVRRTAYDAVSQLRHDLNGVTREEPHAAR